MLYNFSSDIIYSRLFIFIYLFIHSYSIKQVAAKEGFGRNSTGVYAQRWLLWKEERRNESVTYSQRRNIGCSSSRNYDLVRNSHFRLRYLLSKIERQNDFKSHS